MLLMKEPVPVPSEVLVEAVVGAAVVAQQIPLAVIASFPSDVIFPPETAEVRVMDVMTAVVRAGATIATVVAVTSLP
jgi:hypothetical protein